MSELANILQQNAQWAQAHIDADPQYFKRLTGLQKPELLWIGCSDSRVPANVICGLEPGEVFVHRNVANQVYPADLNCMSVLQFAVETLGVKHIIVCGHYGCGGISAAYHGESHGLVEHWLEPVQQLKRDKCEHLDRLPDDNARMNYLCEENVRRQVKTLALSPILRRARDRGQDLTLHSWIYGLDNGLLKDLKCAETHALP